MDDRYLAAGDKIEIDYVYHTSHLRTLTKKAETVGCDLNESSATQIVNQSTCSQ